MKEDYQARREGDRRRFAMQEAWELLNGLMMNIFNPYAGTCREDLDMAIKEAEALSQALIDWYNWEYNSRNWREDS